MKPIIPLTLLLFLSLLPPAVLSQVAKSWCWTKPVKTDKFALDPKLGGENWGYCQASGKATKTTYTISIDTGKVDTEESSDSYFLEIFGEEGKTSEIQLSNDGLQLGSTTIVKTKAQNVGDLTKLKLRTSGTLL